jgi:nitrogen fixation protein FixH
MAPPVSVNGEDAPVKDGKFSTNVTLNEGKNIINIVATNGQAKPEEKVTVTYIRR